MWPWEHVVFGYVVYSLLVRTTFGRRPSGRPVVALVLATQFPDLVDKPMAWWFHVLPSGQSLAHSAIVATAVIGVTLEYSRRRSCLEAGFAFAVGYLTHLTGDSASILFAGEFAAASFLLWPLLPAAELSSRPSVFAQLGSIALTPRFVGRTFVFSLLSLLWWHRDGMPGIAPVRDLFV